MSQRLTLALPIDTAWQFDSTRTQTQLSNNTFLGSTDDRDVLASFIEDAEGEFARETNANMRVSRAGSEGDRETFPQIEYKVPGHADFKRQFTGVSSMYDLEEVEKNLPDGRILPFDSAEGDAAYIYRGLGGSTSGNEWEDVTDEYGDTWGIVDHRSGTVAFSPIELLKTIRGRANGISMRRSSLSKLRFAISYRHGTLGGSRSGAGATTLGVNLDSSETGSKDVEDASDLPDAGGTGGSLILLIGEEYVRATTDPSGDTIDILERGVRGTEAASHDEGDRVQYTPPAVRKAVAARAGMHLIQSGRYTGYLPDNEADLGNSDVMERLEQTWTKTIEAMS